MLLVSLILLFSVLALVLLALLDRYDAALLKNQASRRMQNVPQQVTYYDAFAERRQKSRGTPPQGQPDRRSIAA
jgi:hypothetical protein